MKARTRAERLTKEFTDEHLADTTAESQFQVLVEEVGELAEAISRDLDDEELLEEVADVIFCARAVGYLEVGTNGSDVYRASAKVANENVQKNTETDGAKITKE